MLYSRRIEELGIKNSASLHLVEYDPASIRLLPQSGATEVYNLAAQSFVRVSFDQPLTTAEITGIGSVNLLEDIRIVNPKILFYQSSTSEMFDKVQAHSAARGYSVLPAKPLMASQNVTHI